MSVVLLEDILAGDPVDGQTTELLFYYWNNSAWNDDCTEGLLKVCDWLEIKILTFGLCLNETLVGRTKQIKEFGVMRRRFATNVPYLRHLQRVVILKTPGQAIPNLKFLNRTRVTGLTFNVHHCNREDTFECETKIITERLFTANLSTNYSLQRIFFTSILWPSKQLDNLSCDVRQDYVLRVLKRNRSAWQKCREAALLILGLKRRKIPVGLFFFHRDVLGSIARQVWETRGTKVWAE